jgi:hypothetical protein
MGSFRSLALLLIGFLVFVAQAAHAAAPAITSASPNAGPLAGNTVVTLTGSGFTGATQVTFQGVNGTILSIPNDTTMTVRTPAGTAGSATIALTNADGTGVLAGGFTYVAAPTVTSISPASGPLAGGTLLTINGTNLNAVTQVKIGGVTATGLNVISASQVQVNTPVHTAGNKSVQVTSPGGTANAPTSFTYISAPIITSISPTTGSTAGGTLLTINGTNLGSVTSVTVGGVGATGLTIVSGSQIKVNTPPGTVGLKAVQVTNPGGSTSITNFNYANPPTIASISPTSGYTNGGTTVTVTGTNLDTVTSLTIGGASVTGANLTLVSATQLTFVTPGATAGAKIVTVSNPGGSVNSGTNFTYVAPTISSLDFASGPLAGGTTVEATGTNLSGVTSVTVGGVGATAILSVTATKVRFVTPSQTTAGAKGVVLSASSSTSNSVNFTYFGAPTVNNATPVSITGGSTVTVNGTGFYNNAGFPLTVTVDGTSVTPTIVNTGRFTFTAPPAATAGAKPLVITTASGSVTETTKFVYVDAPVVTSISPASGSKNGGTTVTINGNNLGSITSVTFGGVAGTSISTPITQASFTVVTPPASGGFSVVDVTVTNDRGTFTLPSAFTYTPTVTNAVPGNGPPSGGTSVVITGTGFTGATAVRFGATSATTFDINSDTQITAPAPPGTGTVAVSVSVGGFTGSMSNAFVYAGAPTITSLGTTTGPVGGGTSVVINGSNFSNNRSVTGVTFGGVAVATGSITWNTTGKITVTAPASAGLAEGPVPVVVTTGAGTSNSNFNYTYILPAATISTVAPAAGSSSGGNSVVITGTNFSSLYTTSVKFGTLEAASFVVNSPTQITAVPPAGTPALVDVSVTTAAGTVTKVGAYTFVAPPVVSAVSPTTGATAGGTAVTITGANFTGSTGVTFNGVAATDFSVIDDNTITVTMPAGTAGAANVVVTGPYSTGTLNSAFTYVAPPAITSITPAAGPTGGATAVTIHGSAFSGATSVKFGNTAATSFTVVGGGTQINAIAPAGTAGATDVSVTTAYGTGTLTAGYTYGAPPTFSAVSPATGSTSGGTTITITGAGLDTATGVTVDGVPATNLVLVNSGTITVDTPAGTVGPVDVVVTTPFGTATGTGVFAYGTPPAIIGVSPGTGSSAGGTSVVITGTDLGSATSVTFGGAAGTIGLNSATSITVGTPAGTVGPVDVVVTTPYGSHTRTEAFTYGAAPVISTVTPATGSTAGSTSVTITGTNLSGATSVTFGGVAATIGLNTPTSITVGTPAGTAGPVDVVVTTPYGSHTKTAAFTYGAPPVISVVSPATGSTSGSTSVTITGTDLSGAPSVTFGGVAGTIGLNTSTSITVDTPAGTAGAVDVVVTTPYGSHTKTSAFSYVAPPAISTVSPASGSTAGGASVTITGTNLSNATSVTFSGTAATITGNTATQIIVNTPSKAAGLVDVKVTTAYGSDTRTNAYTYVTPAPTISAVSPATGLITGGTSVTITGTDFTAVSSVKFGTVSAATYNVDSPTQITATAPAGAAGPVDVVVTTATGTATRTNAFTYVTPAPTISSVAPATGSTTGGTSVTITGTNFAAVSSVKFGTVNAATYNVDGPTQITATAPAGAAGPVDVVVTTGTGTATRTNAFTYTVTTPPPTISSVAPATGPTIGGTSVTITGTDFTAVSGVKFETVNAASYTVDSSTQITAIAPAWTAGAVNVSVTTAAGTGNRTNAFTYITPTPAPTISSVSPGSGPVGGGTVVTVTGTDLAGATVVRFGGVSGTITANTGTEITVTSPAGAAGAVDVSVTTPAGTGTLTSAFTYVTPVTPTLTLSPVNSTLPGTVEGRDYRVEFSAAGGSGPYAFTMASGSLPSGLSLDAATGVLSGKAASGAAGTYNFRLVATDAGGLTVQGDYKLEVRAPDHTVPDKVVTVEPGFSPLDVYLNKDVEGGPFTDAVVVYVDPPTAGTAIIARGQVASTAPVLPAGFYLRFTPNPQFSGTARVGYTITSSLGVVNSGVVIYQISESPLAVQDDIAQRERDYVTGRQNLLSETIVVPGLTERRMARAGETTFRHEFMPSDDGLRLGFALTHAVPVGEVGDINIWSRGVLMLRRDGGAEGNGAPGDWGRFELASVGADTLVGDGLLLGLSLHVHDSHDPAKANPRIDGRGWLAGPNLSAEILPNTFLDASILYGQSANMLEDGDRRAEFDTNLWILRGSLKGEIALRNGLSLAPRADVTYLRELVRDHQLVTGTGGRIAIAGFVTQQLRGSIGIDIRREMMLMGSVVVTPSLALDLGYAGMDGSGIFVTMKPGFTATTESGWTFVGGVQISFAEGETLFGVSGNMSRRF